MKQGRKSADQQTVKRTNQHLILHCIRDAKRITRAELAQILHLSPPSVSTNVEELLHRGVLRESGTATREEGPGRKGILLELHPEYGSIITVDLSGKELRMAVFDFAGNKLLWESHGNIEHRSAEEIGHLILHQIETLLERLCLPQHTLRSILICAPGVVNSETGTMRLAPQFIGWDTFDLRQLLKDRFKADVQILNDINVRAIAEYHGGIGRNTPSFVHLNVNVGVGAGIFLQEHIWEGARSSGGEIGYLPIPDVNHPGKWIPLEQVASFSALRRHIAEVTGQDPEYWTAQRISMAYHQGVPAVAEAVDTVAAQLSVAIVTLNAILDVPCISLGGPITELGELFLTTLQQYCKKMECPNPVEVTYSILGEHAIVDGASAIAQDYLIQQIAMGCIE